MEASKRPYHLCKGKFCNTSTISIPTLYANDYHYQFYVDFQLLKTLPKGFSRDRERLECADHDVATMNSVIGIFGIRILFANGKRFLRFDEQHEL